MKISVVIPTFNKQDLLYLTLQSFQLSMFKEFEIIVVNDGGSSLSRIEDVRWKFPCRIVECKHLGRGSARNTAIEMANGELIVFNDDDTIVPPNFLSLIWNEYCSNRKCIIIGQRRQLYLEESEKNNSSRLHFDWNNLLARSKEDIYTSQTRKSIFKKRKISHHWLTCTTGNMAVERERLITCGCFDTNFEGWGFEDIELGYRLIGSGMQVYYNDEIINYHIEHDRKRTEMILEMQKNMLYFYNKYNRKKELYLFWLFYIGRISLNEFDLETYRELDNNENIIYFILFKRHKFENILETEERKWL